MPAASIMEGPRAFACTEMVMPPLNHLSILGGDPLPATRNVEDRRKKDYEPKTGFQKWLKPFLKIGTEQEITYTDIYRRLIDEGIDVTENYVYRIVRGDPDTYKNAARPGYDLALAIGEIVGDPLGGIQSANYKLPSPDNNRVMVTVAHLNGEAIDALVPRSVTSEQLKEIRRALRIALEEE